MVASLHSSEHAKYIAFKYMVFKYMVPEGLGKTKYMVFEYMVRPLFLQISTAAAAAAAPPPPPANRICLRSSQ